MLKHFLCLLSEFSHQSDLVSSNYFEKSFGYRYLNINLWEIHHAVVKIRVQQLKEKLHTM